MPEVQALSDRSAQQQPDGQTRVQPTRQPVLTTRAGCGWRSSTVVPNGWLSRRGAGTAQIGHRVSVLIAIQLWRMRSTCMVFERRGQMMQD